MSLNVAWFTPAAAPPSINFFVHLTPSLKQQEWGKVAQMDSFASNSFEPKFHFLWLRLWPFFLLFGANSLHFKGLNEKLCCSEVSSCPNCKERERERERERESEWKEVSVFVFESVIQWSIPTHNFFNYEMSMYVRVCVCACVRVCGCVVVWLSVCECVHA